MPRYYFDIRDGVCAPDPDGLDLPDTQAAWSEAVRTCGAMLKDIDGQLPQGEWRMEVTDESRQPVFTLRFVGTDHSRPAAANSNLSPGFGDFEPSA